MLISVMYAQEVGGTEETRSHLCYLQGASDGSETFIPEEHGYKVVRIIRGIVCKVFAQYFNALVQ